MKEQINSFDKENLHEYYFNCCLKSTSNKYFSYKNNNDTLNILLSTFSKFKSLILYLYNCFVSYISVMNNFIYHLEMILLIIVFLFSFVITYEDNSEIPTDLIISAYFPKYRITSISYEMIKAEEEIENINLEDINFDEVNKIIKEKINKYKPENIENES